MNDFHDIEGWMREHYSIPYAGYQGGGECKRIFACTYRTYDAQTGATGGPGGMLHMQEKLMGGRFKGIVTQYIYRDSSYRVPDNIWEAFAPFSMKTRLVLAGAGYIGINPEIRKSINKGDNPLLICHDLGCAFGAYLLGLNYIIIYHQQGSILNEIISSGETASEIEQSVLKEAERIAIAHCVQMYFPSKGARMAFIDTSQNASDTFGAKLSELPLYNTIEELTYARAIVPGILKDAWSADGNTEIFLSVSDYNEDKGLDRIPKLLSEYKRQTKKSIVWIAVGNVINRKSYEAIQEACKAYEINSQLVEGRIPHAEVLGLIEKCDFYIMLHRKSIFDISILEAMQMGKKIILSDCIANREFNVLDNIVIYDSDEAKTVKAICGRDDGGWENANIKAYRSAFDNAEFVRRYAHEIKKALFDCGMYNDYSSKVNVKLKVWKNLYQGRRCMICGSGASLESIKEMDKDCIYIALNRALFYPHIKFDFLFMQDNPTDGTYTLEDFNLYNCEKFYGIITNPHLPVKGLGDFGAVPEYVQNSIHRYELAPNTYDYRADSFLMDSESDYIQDAQSVLFSAVTMAVFMGFSHIQLCGVEFSSTNYGNIPNRSHYALNVCNNLISLKKELKEKRQDITFDFYKTENPFLREAFLEIDCKERLTVASIYTADYLPLVELQKKSCMDNYDFESIFISDDEWNQNRSQAGFAFFDGNTIKVRRVIEEIKKHFGGILIFTDADVVFFKNTKGRILQELKGKDMLFLKERSSAELFFERAAANINIGFVVMRCNDRTLKFWETVCNEVASKNGWDQEIVNSMLEDKDYSLSWALLSEEFLNGGSISKENVCWQRICTSCGTIAKRLQLTKEEFLKAALLHHAEGEWF